MALAASRHAPDSLHPATNEELIHLQCDGNGTSAERLWVLYLHDFDTPDRYAANQSRLYVWRPC